jgi:hypothetical protein
LDTKSRRKLIKKTYNPHFSLIVRSRREPLRGAKTLKALLNLVLTEAIALELLVQAIALCNNRERSTVGER